MPVFGLFGSAAPRMQQSAQQLTGRRRRRVTAQDALGFDDPTLAPEPNTPPQGMIGAGAPVDRKKAIPMAGEPSGYTPGKRDWMKEIGSDPLGFFLTGTDGLSQKREEGIMSDYARQSAEQSAQREAEITRLMGSNQPQDRMKLAYLMGDSELGKQVATNFAAANVGAGDSRVYGNGQDTYRAPQNMMNVASDAAVFNPETSGQVYKNAPSPKPPEPFTLNQGDVRFDASGRRIAGVAPRPDADGAYKPPPGFAGLPGGKLDYIPGGPADPAYIDKVSDARARGVPEYSQTEQRKYKSKVTALNEFEAGLNDYFRVLEENGGPQTIEGFWNAQQRKNIDAAHALMTLNLKQAYQGGALDKGLIEIAEKILTDPTGWSSFNGGGAAEFRKAAEPIFNNINYARSQIPETFRGGAQPARQDDVSDLLEKYK